MKKICIVGAGVGGCALSYYLNELHLDIKVDIYEKTSEIGGRIKTVDIEGVKVDLGANFFHSMNKLTMSLVKKLQIELEDETGPSTYGIWNGKKFILNTGDNKYKLLLQMLFRYRRSLFKLRNIIKEFGENYSTYYTEEKVFYTVSEYLDFINLSICLYSFSSPI